MKKHISRLLALAMFISVAIGLRAERVVDMPDFECRKSHVLTVERITLSDNETRVDFRVEAKKGYKGTVGDNSRLKDIITGNCYYPTRAEGVKFNETIRIPAEGYIRYSLFYPPLPDSVKAIDFIEGSWDIFGLRLDGKKATRPARITDPGQLIISREHPPVIAPLFTPGIVHIEGVVDSYDPRTFGKNIQLRTFSPITGNNKLPIIDIQPDGTFACDIQLDGPGFAYISQLRNDLYLEPGHDLFIYIDPEQEAENSKTDQHSIRPVRFGGSLGAINTGLADAPSEPTIRYDRLAKKLTPERMMAHIDSVHNLWDTKVENYMAATPSLHPVAKTILRHNIVNQRAYDHLNYLMHMNRATWQNPSASVNAPTLDYYRNVIPSLLLTDSAYIVSKPTETLLNRLAFCPLPEMLGFDMKNIPLRRPSSLSERVGSIVALLRSCDNLDSKAGYVNEFLGTTATPLLWQMASFAYLTNYYKYSGPLTGTVDDAMQVLDSLKCISHPVLRKALADHFASQYETAGRPSPLPDTEGGKIMRQLIAPYAGKAIFVDFWSTGCGPCRAEIKRNREFRDTHRDGKGYVFLFITGDEDSPENAYNKFVADNMTDDITLRIPQDDFNRLRELYNFSAIPYHTFISPEGHSVINNISFNERTIPTILKRYGIEL